MPESILDLTSACKGDCRDCPPECPIAAQALAERLKVHGGSETVASLGTAAHRNLYEEARSPFEACPKSGCIGCTVSPDNYPNMETTND